MERVPPAFSLLPVPAHTLGPQCQVSADAWADWDCPAPDYDPQPTEKGLGSHSVILSRLYSVTACAGSFISKVVKIPCFRGAYTLLSVIKKYFRYIDVHICICNCVCVCV